MLIDVKDILAGKIGNSPHENRLRRGVNQLRLGMWYEVKDEQTTICYSPTGEMYTILHYVPSCSCPDFEKRQAECKHILALNVWNLLSIGERLSLCPHRDHIVHKKNGVEIRLEGEILVYQNGSTIKSNSILSCGLINHANYREWVKTIQSHK